MGFLTSTRWRTAGWTNRIFSAVCVTPLALSAVRVPLLVLSACWLVSPHSLLFCLPDGSPPGRYKERHLVLQVTLDPTVTESTLSFISIPSPPRSSRDAPRTVSTPRRRRLHDALAAAPDRTASSGGGMEELPIEMEGGHPGEACDRIEITSGLYTAFARRLVPSSGFPYKCQPNSNSEKQSDLWDIKNKYPPLPVNDQLITAPDPTQESPQITQDSLKAYLNHLNTEKSPGADIITNAALKKVRGQPLQRLLQLKQFHSIQHVPPQWKQSSSISAQSAF